MADFIEKTRIWLILGGIFSCVGLGAGVAMADPLLELPPADRGVVVGDPRSSRDSSERPSGQASQVAEATPPGFLALIGEVDILAILGSEPTTTYPDTGAITGGEPELAVARLGLLATRARTWLLVRLDGSEALRVDLDLLKRRPVATVDAFIDDASIWWRPRGWFEVMGGRVVVPFARFRQLERGILASGAVPFAVDRVAPDRRWGATVHGDVGAMSYAAGAYADPDWLELRAGEKIDSSSMDSMEPMEPDGPVDVAPDPSAGGRSIAVLHVGWTPRAPIGPDPLATPEADPWFDTARPAAGLGIMWRHREGVDRFDAALNGQLKYQRFAAIAEILASLEGGEIAASISGEASALITDRAVLFAQAEYDGELGLWTAGGGVGFFATTDRRNKLTLVAWVRREPGSAVKRDGAVVHIQAAF